MRHLVSLSSTNSMRDYESDPDVPRKTLPARELFGDLMKERAETGRIYIMNIDHCNSHSSFNVPVRMSNLCQEITLPTKPLNHIDDEEGEISLCILSAINIGKIRNMNEIPGLCDIAVRALDELIDYQGYPVKAAEKGQNHVGHLASDSSDWPITSLRWENTIMTRKLYNSFTP